MQATKPPAAYKLPRFITEPAEVYHSKRKAFLTSHQLIEFMRCPEIVRLKRGGMIGEPAYSFFKTGAAGHVLTLEGRARFEAEYHVGGPINDRTGKPYGEETKAFADWAKLQTKTVISDRDYAQICQMEYAVRQHPIAAGLLSDGVAEGVLREKIGGVDCQIRCDWFSTRSGLTDYKSCRNLDEFSRPVKFRVPLDDGDFYEETVPGGSVADFHYVEQMAFYRLVLREHTGQDVPVHLIGAEKQEPYRCGVWRISDSRLDEAERWLLYAIDEFRRCLETDIWPTRYEELRWV